MKEALNNFIQANSPDGGFLQSEEWRKFQESYGRKTFNLAYRQAGVSGENFWANMIEYRLPMVGKYFYVPRGPLGETKIGDVISLAKEQGAGWIRIEPADKKTLQSIKYKTVKAPHDMQPKEIFVIDIMKPEEQLMAEMKSKTRYNIKLAEKKGVSVKVISNQTEDAKYYFDRFVELVEITAKRNNIVSHPEEYYRKMWEVLPAEMLKLYVAEYQGKIVAANLILFFGKFSTYLHGASDNEFREVMAPYLLQWQAIKDAKSGGYEKYDFGGISTNYESNTNIRITNKWLGITKFKTGFSPSTLPINFPGSYDIILDKKRYYLYRALQSIKNIF